MRKTGGHRGQGEVTVARGRDTAVSTSIMHRANESRRAAAVTPRIVLVRVLGNIYSSREEFLEVSIGMQFFFFFSSLVLIFPFIILVRVFSKLPLFGVEYWLSGVEWSFEWSFSKSSGNVRMATQNSRYR